MTSLAQPRRLSEPPWVFPMILIVLAGLIFAAIALFDTSDKTSDLSAETGFAEAIGTPLPPLVDGAAADPAVGMQAPVISAQTVDGERAQLLNDGTARVLGFFAHWCPHCQDELPELAAWLSDATLPAGTEVVAVSTSVDPDAPNYPPSAWFAREDWPATALTDDDTGSLASAYGLQTFPYWVVIDADGTVVERFEGRIGAEQLEALVVRATQ